MAKSTKNEISDICADLATIGIEVRPPDYWEMRDQGWISIEEAARVTGKGNSTVGKRLRNAVKAGEWEESKAMVSNRNIVTVYRKIK